MPLFLSDYNPFNLNGTNGFRMPAVAGDPLLGYSVAMIGDVNGDGLADFAIGAPGNFQTASGGAVYVVFGRGGAYTPQFDLFSLDGTNGFRVAGGAAGDQIGQSVSAAGDVNGDGIDDFIIGASGVNVGGNTDFGTAYVIFGQTSGWTSTVSVANLNGTNGFALVGAATGRAAGQVVAGAGDINNDGFDDFIVTEPGYRVSVEFFPGFVVQQSVGQVYVIFGAPTASWSASTSLSNFTNGTRGFIFQGTADESIAGASVAALGDINGDGISDFAIGHAGADPNSVNSAGSVYVVFGGATTWSSTFNPASLNGTNGFRVNGAGVADEVGYGISAAGDVNGDGVNDFIVGAFRANTGAPGATINDAGAAYVIYGRTSGWSASLSLANVDGTNGFAIPGRLVNGLLGFQVSGGGDLNGDGFDDVVVATPFLDPNSNTFNTGAVYAVLGAATGLGPVVDISALNGDNGFAVTSNSSELALGNGVATGADINNDGFDDLVIGAPGHAVAVGTAFVVFGAAPTEAVTRTGTVGANSLSGGAFNDTLIGLAGNDTLRGNGGNDLLNGGLGADRLDGGAGVDTASYANATQGIDVRLGVTGPQTTFGEANGDTLISIENLIGSEFTDRLEGDAGDNTLEGRGESDWLSGGLGTNTLNGGGGIDIASYRNATAPVTVSLAITGFQNTIGAGTDQFISIEGLEGSQFDDVLTGSALNDQIFGENGNDTINAGAGDDLIGPGQGNDTVDGGAGIDRVDFDVTLAGATFVRSVSGSWSVTTTTASEGTDTLTGVEYVQSRSVTLALRPADGTIDGNGTSDILLRNTNGSVQLWTQNGFATVAAQTIGNSDTTYTALGTGDFNGDGRFDILYRNASGAMAQWQMNGATIAATAAYASDPSWTVAGIGDFNGDFRDDILFRNTNGAMAQWQMNGLSTGAVGAFAVSDQAWSIAAIADTNGDGRDDVVWRNSQGILALWQMDGFNTLSTSVIGSSDTAWQIVGSGDFNGDLREDLLWRSSTGVVAIWSMNGASLVQTTVLGGSDTAWSVIDTGDYNGDGRADILWQGPGGSIALWLISGAGVVTSQVVGNPGNGWTDIG